MSKSVSRASDLVATVFAWLSFLLITGVFCWILFDLIHHGFSGLTLEFLISEPQSSGRKGGIGPILVSTSYILLVCLAVAVPIGVGTAILLSEFTPRESVFGRAVRRSLDILSGVPSIVFGLFGNALFCKALGLGFSILSGGLTLACMSLPLLIRSVEEGFRAVPQDYRLSAAALGISRVSVLLRLLLPSAAPGIVVGLVLGIGRALAETAALIFTSGYVDRMPTSVFDSGRSLALHIFDLSMNVSGGDSAAYRSSLALVALLLLINTTASIISDRFLHKRLVTV